MGEILRGKMDGTKSNYCILSDINESKNLNNDVLLLNLQFIESQFL